MFKQKTKRGHINWLILKMNDLIWAKDGTVKITSASGQGSLIF